jgi:hypothetical protein
VPISPKINFRTIQAIEGRFRDAYEALQQEQHLTVDQLKNGVEKVKYYRELYALTSTFPEWPFNVRSLARFSASAISPILLAPVPMFIDKLI